jgi:hypothetical protein
MWVVPGLYNESVFAAKMTLDERLVQRSTGSRTTQTEIGELGRVLESGQSKVIEEEMTRHHREVEIRCQDTTGGD